ncbi:MAG: hypothetical protein JOZ07_18050 [Solirubrobacterales bacterium]|nr:hypothetical protein [Solirubrobacterales bacterium]
MSTLAYPRTGQRRLRRTPAAFASRWGSDTLLGVALAALALVLVAHLAADINVDSWLQLVTGRQIWTNGIPHRETLTIIGHGERWVDQQWLAQLAGYAIDRAGGLALLGLVNIALLVGSVAGAVAGARRLGAPSRSVLLVLPAAVTLMMPSREIRTQELAMPLFVATAYLLARDSRSPSFKALWCLPILTLWANLHGSVTLGAGLVVLRGLTLGWERRRELGRHAGAWRQPLALVLGAPLAIMLTPYGLAIVGYYHATMADPLLRHFVSEWRPITSIPVVAAVTFGLAAGTLWSFGAHPDKTTLWEKLAFLLLVAGTISVVRNALFCGLYAAMTVPVSWAYGPTVAERTHGSRTVVNAGLAFAAALAIVVGTAVTLTRGDGSLASITEPPGVLAAVQRATAADPSLHVLADGHFSDWLLWRDPRLAGHMANDARFELLTARQLTGIAAFMNVVGTHWKAAARGYRLVVLRPSADPSAATILHEPGSRVLYRQADALVILRNAREARSA